jgi:hypothetical protein
LKKASWMKRLYGAMLKRSAADVGVDAWIASQVDTRVSLLAPRASGEAPKILDIFGRTSLTSSMISGLDTSSSKMSTGMSLKDSTKSPDSYKKWVTWLRRIALARRKWAVHMFENDSSLWDSTLRGSYAKNLYPTPAAEHYGTSQNEGQVPHPRPSAGTESLETWARNTWATPRAMTGGPETAERKQELGRKRSGGSDLQSEAQNWPTVTVADSRSSGRHTTDPSKAMHPGTMLVDAVRDFLPDQMTMTDGSSISPPMLAVFQLCPWLLLDKGLRRLNPRFVEALMGYPTDWSSAAYPIDPSDFERWVTRWSQLVPHLLLRRCASDWL